MLGNRLVLIRPEPRKLDARSSLEANLAPHDRLQREQAKLAILAVGQIFLVTSQPDVLIEILNAACSAPAAALVLHKISAHLAAAGEEARSDFARWLELVVMIFADAAAELEQLECAADRHVDPRIGARLPTIEGRLFGLDRGIEREADRDAVAERVVSDRHTNVEIAVDI